MFGWMWQTNMLWLWSKKLGLRCNSWPCSANPFLIMHPSLMPDTIQFSNQIINFGSLCAQCLAKNNANLLPSSFDIMRLRFNTKGVAQIGFWLISIKIQLFAISNKSVSSVIFFKFSIKKLSLHLLSESTKMLFYYKMHMFFLVCTLELMSFLISPE